MRLVLCCLFLFALSVAGFAQPLSPIWPPSGFVTEQDTMAFQWNGYPDAISYQLTYDTVMGLPNPQVVNTTAMQATVTGLVMGKTYYWQVEADTGNGFDVAGTARSFPTFSPATLPNLVLWLRADQNVATSGASVTSWSSISPPGISFDQGTGSKRPTLVQSGLNGKPIVQFDGNNDVLSAGDVLDPGSKSRTLVLVGLTNISSSSSSFIAKALAANSPNRWALVHDGSTNLVYLHHDNTNQTIGINSIPGKYHLNSITTNRNTQTVQLHQSGVLKGSLSNISGPSWSIQSSFRLLLGAYNNANDNGELNNLNGAIPEVVMCDTFLTDSLRQITEQYLRFRYAPSLNLGKDINRTYGVCKVVLDAGTGFQAYQWSTGNTAFMDTVTTSGTYSVTVTDQFGYTSADTVIIDIPAPPNVLAQYIFCSGDTLVWNTGYGIGPYTFLWSDQSAQPFLNITGPGNYGVTITDTSGCTYQSPIVTVFEDSTPMATDLGADTSLCEGNLLGVQTGNYPVTYQWNTGSMDSVAVAINTGIYSVTTTSVNGCTGTDSIQVIISGVAPTASFSADTVCRGEPTTFTDLSSVPTPNTIVGWLWVIDGDTVGTTGQFSEVIAGSGRIPVQLTVTSDAGCTKSIIDTILIHPPSTASFVFQPDTPCANAPVFLFDQSTVPPGDQIVSWTYDFGGGDVLQGPDTIYRFPNMGTFQVTYQIETVKGCISDTLISIPVFGSAAEPAPTRLIKPADGFTGLQEPVPFQWNTNPDNAYYTLEIATDPAFNQIAFRQPFINAGTYTWLPSQAQTYYWRVLSFSRCGDSIISSARSFHIVDLDGLGNLAFWIKSDSGVTLNGATEVASWRDLSQGLVADQANSGKRPSLITSPWNAKSAIRFDGNDDVLSLGDTLDLGTNSRTLFLVGQSQNQIGSAFYAKALAGNNSNRLSLTFSGTGDLLSLYHDQNQYSINVIENANRPRIYTTRVDRSQGLHTLFTSGQQRGSISGLLGPTYDFNSTFRFLLGAYNDAQDNGEVSYLNGDIAEMLIFNDALSDTSRLLVESYLRHTYSPPVNLGSDIYVDYGFCDTTLQAQQTWFADFSWNTGANTASITVKKPGLYHVTVTDVFGYVSADTLRLWHPAKFLQDTAICLGDTLTWNTELSTSEYTISWPDGSGNSSFDITEEGLYWVIIEDQNGCTITDTIFVDVDSFAIQATLGPDADLCSGNEIGLVVGANEAVSYQWSTGDNTPTTVVQNPGAYWVEVTNVNGCEATDTFNVQIIGAVPTPDFTATALCLGQSAQFTDQSQAAPGDVLNQWMWAFGDDSMSALQHPTHTYADSGTYDITLTVSTTDGCVHATTKTLFVNPLPILHFNHDPQHPCQFESIQFVDSSTVYNGFMTQWHWDFGNGDTSILQNPEYAYNSPINTDVRLIGTSNHGCRDTVVYSLLVKGSPLANFSYGPACSGQLTQFTDASDQGQSGPINSWLWDFGDSTSSAIKSPAHIFNDPGTYDVNLRVGSTTNCFTDTTIQVTVSQTPAASFAPDSACVGSPVQFSDETDTFNVGITRWRWEFGDGGSDTVQDPMHAYADAGTYGVKLVVEDAVGCIDSVIGPVNIATNPTAAFSFNPTYGAAPIDITFQANTPGSNDFEWYVEDSLGNETFAGTGSSPVFTFTENGVYRVTQIVTNPNGCRDTLTRELFIAIPILDLWVDHVILVQDILPDGSYKVNMAARVRNKGSRVVSSFDLYATLGAGSTIVEGWEGTMNPGDVILHQFQSAFFVADASNNPFICIEAKNLNGSEADDFPADNILCEPIEDIIKVLDPYPNPAGSSVTVDVVIPKAEQLTIRIFNALGQEVRTVHDSPGTRGLNRFHVPLADVPNGTFFVRVRYREEVYVKAFVVGR